MLCHEGAATCLTRDHKPDDPIEVARVEAAGLFIARNRVQGSLAMTRALGDAKYKTAEGAWLVWLAVVAGVVWRDEAAVAGQPWQACLCGSCLCGGTTRGREMCAL